MFSVKCGQDKELNQTAKDGFFEYPQQRTIGQEQK